MRVVVTGGTGFLGAHIARALAARGDEVICFDVAPQSRLLEGIAGIETRRVDVTAWAELAQALREARPMVVFHTAGILSAFAEQRPHAAYEVNASGTHAVLEAAVLLGIERVIFTSTMATYGPGAGEVVDERTQQRPTTMYGVTKVFGELLGEWFHRTLGLDFRAIRFPSVIGAGRGPGGASAYSSLMVSEPLRDRPYAVPVTESTESPLLYVRDAVEGILRYAAADGATLTRRTYGVTGTSPTAGAIAEAVRRRKPDAPLTFAPDEATLAIVESWPRRIDDSAARDDWGWAPGRDVGAIVDDFATELAAHPDWP